eukprot:CAMPEP_0113661550 /NCGR_PEP_ID=MMETSP0038_2-20120614/35_1 /TAXON_ID=2898 /ORGANISM="Cryptomonas paramecium" /LENGTH=96 /DNA_ID=CAMNT_0000576251 /DNA_START=222 /DNA_END=509 /DNA_ORIENTATION=+ /assembly_acc=CAM_ASM_000170
MNFIQNIFKRHPEADRPLIDFDTGLILEITTLLGTVIGVDLNRVSPVWAITVSLVGVLGYTTRRTLDKAAELRDKEERAAAAAAAATSAAEEEGDE